MRKLISKKKIFRNLSPSEGDSGRKGYWQLFVFLLGIMGLADIALAVQSANWKTDWDATVRAAEKEGQLVIYGPRGQDQETLYSQVFAKAFPKIRVQYTPGRLSQQISRLMAEQRAGVRQVDLLLGGTDVLLGTFKDKGLLQPIRPLLVLPEVLDPAAWFKGKLLFADSEEKYIALYRAVPYSSACINTNLIKPNELKSYWDLVNPKWKGKIASQDFSSGSARNQMYVIYVREDLGPKYLKRLVSEMDITFSRNVVQLGDWLAQGKFAIALGGVDCPDLTLKGLPVKTIFLEGLAAVGAGNDPASMLASAPHTNASKVFLNWILTREGQMAFQKLTKENSLRIDIPKDGIVDPDLRLDPKREYLFTGLEEHKKKINEFEPWLESLVPKK
jgi:iron(III) transport system substrate-binding protein